MNNRWDTGARFTEGQDDEWFGGIKNDFRNPNNPKFKSLMDLAKKINSNIINRMGKVI